MDPRPQQRDSPVAREHARRFQWATRWEGPTQERSVSLASLALDSRSRRSETGLFEVGSGELAGARRGREALLHDAGDLLRRLWCAGAQRDADPSVRVGPDFEVADFRWRASIFENGRLIRLPRQQTSAAKPQLRPPQPLQS
jgi:hypothetical protein